MRPSSSVHLTRKLDLGSQLSFHMLIDPSFSTLHMLIDLPFLTLHFKPSFNNFLVPHILLHINKRLEPNLTSRKCLSFKYFSLKTLAAKEDVLVRIHQRCLANIAWLKHSTSLKSNSTLFFRQLYLFLVKPMNSFFLLHMPPPEIWHNLSKITTSSFW